MLGNNRYTIGGTQPSSSIVPGKIMREIVILNYSHHGHLFFDHNPQGNPEAPQTDVLASIKKSIENYGSVWDELSKL